MGSGVLRQFLANFSVSIAVFIVGTALGWPSPVLYNILEHGEPMNMTHGEAGVMVSLLYLGNMLSPIPSGMLMDKIGRKMTLHVLSVVPLAAWFLVYFAKKPMMLYMARLLVGTWLGTVNTIVPTYVGEVSEPKVRGAFSTFFQLMTNVGVLFAYVIGPFVDYYTFAWILGVIPLIFAVSMFVIPESPYWLVKKGRHEKAAAALAWLRSKPVEEVKKELSEIEETVTNDTRRGKSYRELIATRGNRKALLMVEMLAITQRASGISALMAYLSTTLPIDGPMEPNECVTFIGIVLFASVFFSTFLVDRSGRRPLLLTSSWGSAAFMLLAGLWFFLDEKTEVNVRGVAWVPFFALIGYSFFFCIGLGPLATTMQGEVFPTNIKGHASGITSIVLAFTSFVSNMWFFKMADTIGLFMNYLIFSVACVVAAIFVQFWVVETKGRTLNQIQKELNEKRVKILQPVV